MPHRDSIAPSPSGFKTEIVNKTLNHQPLDHPPDREPAKKQGQQENPAKGEEKIPIESLLGKRPAEVYGGGEREDPDNLL